MDDAESFHSGAAGLLTSNQSHAQIAKLTSHLMALAVAMPCHLRCCQARRSAEKPEHIQQH
jgi:hypothetical protein